MSPLEAAALGVVQALTEFLPVSSSGHLVLAKSLLDVKVEGGAAFEVAVHFGTLLSVLVLFRAEVRRLLGSVFRAARAPTALRAQWRSDEHLRFVGAILLGCIPAGLVGVLFKDELESAFDSPRLVGGALIATGVWLLASNYARPAKGQVTLGRAWWIGVAQAIAIVPGVSRSGSTIAAGEFLGVQPEVAARFSFLMSLPVIFGATLLKFGDLMESPPGADLLVALGVGAAVSFGAGLGALWLLMGVVRRGWFHRFGWYCLAAGILAVATL